MIKTNLIGYTRQRMEELMLSLGEKPYKGRQLFKWLYKNRQYDFNLMSDLTIDLRNNLDNKFIFQSLIPEDIAESKDGSRKYLFRIFDNHPIETVLMPDENGRRTVCVSSQAGCAFGCKFCATGTMGLSRNLTLGEIIGQLIHIRDEIGDNAYSNIVFMGMGEPLQNLDTVIAAVEIIRASDGMSLSSKKITISTCGLPGQIRILGDARLKIKLAVSLNSAIQEKRARIMPVANTHNLNNLMDACRYYIEKTKSRVTFEYLLMKGFNDQNEDIEALRKLTAGIACKINVMAYNPVKDLDFKAPTEQELDSFVKQLSSLPAAITVRKSRGADIQAACGQLAASKLHGR